MKTVTICVPVYNEQENIIEFYNVMTETMLTVSDKYLYEILFINDGSVDNTYSLIKELSEKDSRVSCVNLSRNYGKEIAMASGFDYAKGDCLVGIDVDLQQPPKYILEMLTYWEQGYQDVYGKRVKRGGESFLKKKTSTLYYKLLNNLSTTDVLPEVGDFRLLDRVCIDSIKQLRENQRYTKGLYMWVGFKKKEIEFEAVERFGGKTKWGFGHLFDLAINGITSHTVKPLRIATYTGLLVSLASFIYLMVVLIQTLIFGIVVSGYASTLVTILFLGGCQLIGLGLIGEYVGKIFIETKNRPLYFVQDYIESDINKK